MPMNSPEPPVRVDTRNHPLPIVSRLAGASDEVFDAVSVLRSKGAIVEETAVFVETKKRWKDSRERS